MKLIKNSFMIGVMYGLVISVLFSAIAGHGHYYPLSPMSLMGNFYLSHFSETAVMIISILIWGCIGILFGQTNRIFEETDWSITRATVTHFVLTYVGFVPLAIFAGWFPLNIFALATFTFIFILIYFIIWTYHYKKNQKIVQQINHQIEKR